jgi:Flp pilus assembly protein TadG
MIITPEKKVNQQRRGNAIIEFSFLAAWLLFLFIGALDWGFYSYSLIATQAAARIGALYASTSPSTVVDSAGVCVYALDQLRKMPNVGSSVVSCGSGTSVGASAPVSVSVTAVSGVDGKPAAQVSVTYQTPHLIPLMKLLPSQVTITRTTQMRMQS